MGLLGMGHNKILVLNSLCRVCPGNPAKGKNIKGFDMTAKISEILDLQHKEIMYALEQMKEAEKLVWKEAMAKAGFHAKAHSLIG